MPMHFLPLAFSSYQRKFSNNACPTVSDGSHFIDSTARFSTHIHVCNIKIVGVISAPPFNYTRIEGEGGFRQRGNNLALPLNTFILLLIRVKQFLHPNYNRKAKKYNKKESGCRSCKQKHSAENRGSKENNRLKRK